MPEKYSQVLPKGWDGRFPFTNDSDEDFTFVWGKKAYLFPARKTVDMMKMGFNQTPIEVQNIRKFAARKWAEEMFFKSPKYASLRANEGTRDENGVIQPRLGSFHAARSYTDSDLAQGIQMCLTPLPEVSALIKEGTVEPTVGQNGQTVEEALHKKDDGTPTHYIIDDASQSVAPGQILLN